MRQRNQGEGGCCFTESDDNFITPRGINFLELCVYTRIKYREIYTYKKNKRKEAGGENMKIKCLKNGVEE